MKLQQGEISEIIGKGKLKNLFAPIDNASIVFFRIVFGAVMFWEVIRYFNKGWIGKYWISPKFNFSYAPFNFEPLPELGMYALWFVLGGLAISIMLGLFYRISSILFFLLFSYTFLLEQARYLNHFYLVILVSFILIFIPAHRNFSIDALLFKKIKTKLSPAWHLWLIRFVIALPYFFGGIAKINSDWLQGYPMRRWLLKDMDFPIIGKYFNQAWMGLTMSYSGLFLDLLIVPMLLFKRTRVIGFIIITGFHLMNAQLFTIGIFPWFMIGATAIFFSPSWPKRCLNFCSFGRLKFSKIRIENTSQKRFKIQKRILIFLFFFVGIQVALPLRHFFINSNVHWTEEGHRYSWHMKLRSKSASTKFFILDKATGDTSRVKTKRYLKKWQRKKMEDRPVMIWQFAQFLKKEYLKKGKDVEVYVKVRASLNGRKYQTLIDPKVDLTTQKRPSWGHSLWVLPLYVPLNDQR